jgi:Secretion system C-terminal sorting domain
MKKTYSALLVVCALLYSLPGDCQSCDVPLTNKNCNQIFNNNFTPIWADCFNSWGFSPFFRCFPDWGLTHGSPQVNLTSPLIGPSINHACMWAYNNPINMLPPTPPIPNYTGEGIATRIPNLLPGHKYAITYIPNVGQVLISNNTKQLSHSLSSVSNGNQLIKFQLKNTTYGCNDLTTPTYIFYGETLFPTEEMGNYKPNFNRVISTPFNYSYGPGAIYTWNIPGAVITDIDPSTPDAMAYFPANIPIPDVTGTLIVTNSAYCNGVYNLHFNYNPNARGNNIMRTPKPSIADEKIIIKSKIYPNPAASLITIESTSIIQSILISNELGLLSKSVRSRGKKTISISITDLKSGVYNCQIVTEKGIENQKLIIKQ